MFAVDLPDDFKKLMEAYNKAFKQRSELMKPYAENIAMLQKFFQRIHEQTGPLMRQIREAAKVLAEINEGIRKSFVQSIDMLVEPKQYKSNKVKLPRLIHDIAFNTVVSIDEDISKQPFRYLRGRLEIGIHAHTQKNYYLSIYCFFSIIDGLLTWFYATRKNNKGYPNFNKKLENFFDTYNFEQFLQAQKMREKFDIFVLHRNQIMHGDKYARFDKNISTIAMLFLIIVYNSIIQKQE